MISNPFEFHAPPSLDAVLALLAEHGDDAKLLAGGMSLVPMMTLGLAQPDVVVSLNHVEGLSYIREDRKILRIGARTPHAEVAASPLVLEHLPLLAEAASRVGDVQVRNRGTIGGSLAHADPTANYTVAALALGATLTIRSSSGNREVPAEEFFVGLLQTDVGQGDVLAEISIPKQKPAAGGAYLGFVRVEGTFAIVNAAAAVSPDGRSGRVAIGGVGSTPEWFPLDPLLGAGGLADIETFDEAVTEAAQDAMGDLNGTPLYKQAMAKIFARRAVETALARRGRA